MRDGLYDRLFYFAIIYIVGEKSVYHKYENITIKWIF